MPQSLVYKTNMKCPYCNSKKLTTAGKGVAEGYKVKTRYRCWNCDKTTVNPKRI